MRFKGLDLNLLVALNVMLDERSVSAAARRLFLSQSATSGALARLREHYGDELLVPIGRKMVPTAFAESLIDPLRELMSHIDATVSPGQAFDPSTTRRTFRISCSDYITEVVMSRLAPLVAREAPGAILDILAPSSNPTGALDAGQIDILITPDVYAAPNHPFELFYEEHHVVVAWKENELLADGRMDEHRFASLGHVVVRFDSFRTTSMAETWLDENFPKRRIELVTSAFIHVPRLVVGTQRIAIMHARMAQMQMKVLPIRIFESPFEMPPLKEIIQYHRARQSDGGLRWLSGMIRRSIADIK
ncbi:LysR family transcriptional regulator [Brevundimonas sp. SL130]|uniref:LysR family transcriptional regulator n=1 Tax=Brevundimonas sp. SL130 TaxID=2995143 RepID=UPI00226C8813|nr:LysR family transcriptional regulator [Brevundimonas sp. SL130]WAC59041.1 LysR family transcriptional regulator [Brevundimonas sp. SL130]